MTAHAADEKLAANQPVEPSEEEVRARGLLGRQGAAWVTAGSVGLLAGPAIGRAIGVAGPLVRAAGGGVAVAGAITAVGAVGEDWVGATRRALAGNVVMGVGLSTLAFGCRRRRLSGVALLGGSVVSGALAARQVRVLLDQQGPVVA